jgi:hypothetical protein
MWGNEELMAGWGEDVLFRLAKQIVFVREQISCLRDSNDFFLNRQQSSRFFGETDAFDDSELAILSYWNSTWPEDHGIQLLRIWGYLQAL